MLYVKTHVGNGEWEIFEVGSNLRYLTLNCVVSVNGGDHDYRADDRFPDADHIHVRSIERRLGDNDAGLFVSWVAWESGDERHLLITNGSTFLCNERGDTIEKVHRDPPLSSERTDRRILTTQ